MNAIERNVALFTLTQFIHTYTANDASAKNIFYSIAKHWHIDDFELQLHCAYGATVT
jgi:hypothetical protein